MKLIQADYESIEDDEVHQLKVKSAAGVNVTLIERGDGYIAISVDPSGYDYISGLKPREIAFNRGQVRVEVRGTTE